MSWRSRFEKIEGAREQRSSQPSQGPSLPRFEDPAAAPTGGDSGATTPRPLTDEERHAALEHLIKVLPTMECPSCHQENSKFYPTCLFCSHRLDGDDAIEHNTLRLQRIEVERLKEDLALERRLGPAPGTPVADSSAPMATRPDAAAVWPPPRMPARLAVGLTLGLLLIGPVVGSGRLTAVGALAALGLWAWRWSGGEDGGPRG